MNNQNPQNISHILIKKSTGEKEYFSSEKLMHSLRNAGANESVIATIVADIEEWIYPGVTTKKIYSRAYSLFRRLQDTTSFRYRLKQAILDLGPSGYPFEILIGELYSLQGYDVEVGQVLEGKCVSHEMDVIATKGNTQYLMECKYRQDQGKQISIQVPLYVHSRVNDIVSVRKNMPEYQGFEFVGYVVTNTRFSEDSMEYSMGCGLKLLSWDFPRGRGLKQQIEKFRLYPITILRDLNKREKQYLLNHKIVLCTQLLYQLEVLDELGLNENKYRKVLNELNFICNYSIKTSK